MATCAQRAMSDGGRSTLARPPGDKRRSIPWRAGVAGTTRWPGKALGITVEADKDHSAPGVLGYFRSAWEGRCWTGPRASRVLPLRGAKPPLTPWSTSKILSSRRSTPRSRSSLVLRCPRPYLHARRKRSNPLGLRCGSGRLIQTESARTRRPRRSGAAPSPASAPPVAAAVRLPCPSCRAWHWRRSGHPQDARPAHRTADRRAGSRP
jgi:hypothetical protein